MDTKKEPQSGFTVIEIVMALAIVALIGVVAWQAVVKHNSARVTAVTPSPSVSISPASPAVKGQAGASASANTSPVVLPIKESKI